MKPLFLSLFLVSGLGISSLSAKAGSLSGKADEAKEQRVQSDLTALTIGLDTFKKACDVYPTTKQGLAALVSQPEDFTGKRWLPFMASPPTDPWNHPYAYRFPGIHNPKSYDIFSFGPDGKESGDDLGNWKSKTSPGQASQ